jgi:hypothetical protein
LGWEVRRGIDDSLDGVLGSLSARDVYSLDENLWQTYAYGDISDIENFLLGVTLDQDSIKDLANLNLNLSPVRKRPFQRVLYVPMILVCELSRRAAAGLR